MTSEEKLCPIMSRCIIDSHVDHIIATAYCQKERCAAWYDREIPTGNGREIRRETGCRLIP